MVCRGCGTPEATGCLLTQADSECFTTDGVGSQADPFTIAPILNVSVNNLFTCTPSGLLGSLPAILKAPPFVQVYKPTNQSIPNNTMTAFSFSAEFYDTDTMHTSGAPTRITFTTAGKYIITVYAAWERNVTGDRVVQVRKNGADIIAYDSRKTGGADLRIAHNWTFEEQFSAADFIEVMGQQTSGAALDLFADNGAPLVSALRRGA